MKKRGLILILVMLFALFYSIIFAAQLSSAVDSFDGWKYNYETFLVGDDIFSIVAYNDFQQIKLKVNGEKTFLIDLGDCVVDSLDEYCFTEIDWEKKTIDQFDHLTPALKLKFRELAAKITIKRTILPTEMEKDESGVVTVVIENTGQKDAKSLIYKDELPDNVQVVSASGGALFIGNTVSWSFGALSPGKKKEFSYKVRPVKYKTRDNTAVVSYTYEGVNQNATSSKLSFKVKSPFETKASLSNSKPPIRQPIDYKYTITNKEIDKDISTYTTITLPPEAEVLTFSTGLKRLAQNVFVLDTTLTPGYVRDVTIKIRGDYTGEYKITAESRIFAKNKYIYDYEETKYTIKTDRITPSIYLNVQDIRSGEPFEPTLVLKNDDDTKTYKNINVHFYSEYFDENLKVDNLVPGKEYIFSKKYYASLTDEKVSIPIIANGTFQTLEGETFDFYTKKSLAVGPINSSLSISQTTNAKNIEKGQEFTFEVFVKNLKDDPLINVQVDDYYPEELELVQGKPTILLPTIKRDENAKAYSYKLRIPYDFPDNQIKIVTAASTIIQGQLYEYSAEKTIAVLNATNPPDSQNQTTGKDEQNASQAGNQSTENSSMGGTGTGTSQQEEKQGFFSELWNGIKDFFNAIF